jgi:hypothetical protein
MKKIISLSRSKDSFKHGDWLMLTDILKVGDEVNIVKPDEPGDKIRVFRVIKNRGFLHQFSACDKRSHVSGLEKGMRFLCISK